MLCQMGFLFFDMKYQNALNNCKINALQSPLGCLDMSIGYTDMICVTHLSVMVLSVLFCLGDQQQGLHSLIWKTLLLGEGPGFLSIFWRWQTKWFWLVSSLDSEWPVSPLFKCLLLACTTFIFLSLTVVATLPEIFFFSQCQSLSQESAAAVSGAEAAGPSWAQRWFVLLPWHHLPWGLIAALEPQQ